MTTPTIKIFYKSRQANQDSYWSQPESIESLVNTHVELPSQVRENLAFLHGAFDLVQDTDFLLTQIFRTMNNDTANPLSVYHKTGGLQDWMFDNGIGHTSMSRNDVVRIGNQYFCCDSAGWTQLN